MTEFEKMTSGLAHMPYSDELVAMRLQCKEMLYDYNQLRPSQRAEKDELIQKILGKVGNIPHIVQPFFCDYGSQIEVGKNFFANFGCTMLDSGGIQIGDNVLLGPNVSLYSVEHPLDPELRQAEWEHGRKIRIGNNVWIAGSVTIIGGVTIGDNVVIGAGSVVTKDIPANSLAIGNPCRVLRKITEQDRLDYVERYFKSN